MKQVANYLNGKFLINNIKADKKEMLKGPLLASFSVGSLGAQKIIVEYYDTQDFFFAEKGINIYTTSTKIEKTLIIRYDSNQVSRIEFLKNIPNFFKINIGLKEGITKYYDKIIEAIYQVFPTGLNVNVEDYLRMSSVQVRINKKSDAYRVVNNNGLKVTLSYEICEYLKLGSRQKFTQPTLDIVCDSAHQKDKFNEFLRDVIINHPKLIKIDNNELTLARNNL